MATMGQLAQGAAPLSDLTYYNNRSVGGIGADEVNSSRAQNMLAALQKYDPNAQFTQSYGGDGQPLGYTLNFDASKLPGVSGQGALGAGGAGMTGVGSGATFMPQFSTVQDRMVLANPNAVGNSPVYGRVTDNRNIVQDDDWIAKWGGPALVSLFSMGIGGLAGLMSNGAITAANGAGAGANALGRALGNFGVNTARSLGNGNGFDPLSLLPVAGAGFGLPSWMTGGAQTLGRLAQGAKPQVNPLALAGPAASLITNGMG